MKEAAAYRVKYLKGVYRILPILLGWHLKNRDGSKMSVTRLEELLAEILGSFHAAEANHESVCIEVGKNGPEVLKWNIELRGGDKAIAEVGANILYCTVGHTVDKMPNDRISRYFWRAGMRSAMGDKARRGRCPRTAVRVR